MAETRKVLGQLNPGSTGGSLYTVPASTQVVCSSIVVCNTGSVGDNFTVRIKVNNAADDQKQYLYFETDIEAKTTFTATLGITLSAGDVVKVYAASTDTIFNLFGVEIT